MASELDKKTKENIAINSKIGFDEKKYAKELENNNEDKA